MTITNAGKEGITSDKTTPNRPMFVSDTKKGEKLQGKDLSFDDSSLSPSQPVSLFRLTYGFYNRITGISKK